MEENNRGFYHVPRNNENNSAENEEKRRVKKFAAAAAVGIAVLLITEYGDRLSDMSDTPFTAAGRVVNAVAEYSASLCFIDVSGAFDIPDTKTSDSSPQSGTEDLIIVYDDSLMLSEGSSRIPSSANEEIYSDDILLPAPSAESDSPAPYPSDALDNDGKITEVTYGYYTGENYIDLDKGGQIRNLTSRSNDEVYAQSRLLPNFTIDLDAGEDEPQVLIMHTHTTESFELYRKNYYDSDFVGRTTDSDMNMIAVGNAMAEVFEERGISVLHNTDIHDYPSYNGSYDRSRETVKKLLEKYPSIKVVLDVHRDAIERENGERIAPTAEINGRSSAQVMLICGCDDGTMNMPDCMKNLSTASLFQQAMESKYSGLTRPVLFDYRQYNQDLTTGSLLLEVGGHANSIDQAIYAGELAADAISDALISIGQ